MILRIFVFFLLCFSTICLANANQENYKSAKLKLAFIIYRHGDRTPLDPYPTDPWNNLKYWPTSWGELTNRGKMQQFELGQWLRKRYNKLLSSQYNTSEIYVRSTDFDRTLMSALANLAGLYVPEGTDVWKKDLMWQPVPVHSVPSQYDSQLGGTAPCKAFEREYETLLNSEEIVKLDTKFNDLYNYLYNYTGREIRTLRDVHFLNNTLLIESLYELKLPEWTVGYYPSENMTWISNFVFTLNTYTRKLARLKSGPLLDDILTRLEEKVEGKLDPDRSVYAYSAHDTTIANLLNTLKLFELHSPPYAACLMFELHIKEQHVPFVSIFYKNTTAEPKPMYIPNCGYQCSLSTMRKLYDDVIPKDWERECRISTLSMSYSDANIGQATAIFVGFIMSMMIICYFLRLYCRRRNFHTYPGYMRVT